MPYVTFGASARLLQLNALLIVTKEQTQREWFTTTQVYGDRGKVVSFVSVLPTPAE